MKVLILINPNAGGGKSIRYIDDIKSLFTKYDIEFKLLVTNDLIQLNSELNEVDFGKYDGLIVAGGDGTFFNVLNQFMRLPNRPEIPFGVLPIGTGNSFSRDIIDGEASLEDFVRIIKDGHTRRIDLAKVESPQEAFYFANMMGFGFITDVSATAARLKMFKKMSYTLGVLYNTILLNTFNLRITIDGEAHNWKNVFVILSNSKYTGGNYLIAPRAKLDDGKLDLIIVNKLKRLHLLQTFPKIFDGSHVDTEYVDYIQAKEIELEADVNKTLSPDGEVYGKFPVTVSCVPGALLVFGS